MARAFTSLSATAAVALVASAWFTSTADAAFIQGTCSVNDVTATGSPPNSSADACANFSGNDTGFESSINATFGTTGTWYLLGKSDAANDPVGDISTVPEVFSGNWSLTQAISAAFVVNVKASTFFASYLFSDLNEFYSVTGGSFNVNGVTKDADPNKPNKRAGLSHISVYWQKNSPCAGANCAPPPVPVPAALPLLASGLGALGFLGWRRKRKSV